MHRVLALAERRRDRTGDRALEDAGSGGADRRHRWWSVGIDQSDAGMSGQPVERIEILLGRCAGLGDPAEVQAGRRAMEGPERDRTDDVAGSDLIAGGNTGGHRLVGRPFRSVVDGHHVGPGDTSGKSHHAGRHGTDRCADQGPEIDAAVPGTVGGFRCIERAGHCRRAVDAVDWPFPGAVAGSDGGCHRGQQDRRDGDGEQVSSHSASPRRSPCRSNRSRAGCGRHPHGPAAVDFPPSAVLP